MRRTAAFACLALAAAAAAPAPATAGDEGWAEASRAVQKALAGKDAGDLADALYALRSFDGEPAARLLLSAAFRREAPDFVLDAACDALRQMRSAEAAAVFVEEAARTRDDRRFLLLEALGELKHASAEEALVAAAEDRDPRFRTAAVRALADHPQPAAPARIVAERACADPDPRVRSAGIAALTAWKGLPGALPLLGRLAVERGRLYGDAWRGLRRISGQEFPPEPAKWADWWRTQPGEDAWTWGTPPNPAPASFEVAGLRCWSRRVVFVLDLSDGMADKPGYRPDELIPDDVRKEAGPFLAEWEGIRSRLDHARCHLLRALRALPADASFEIVFGAEAPHALFGNLEPATPENREKAADRLRGLNAKQRQDFHRLIRAAAAGRSEADPLSPAAGADGADTVVYLGTALPSYGQELDPGRIVSSVRRWNRVRQIRFLGVGVGNHGAGLLADLASLLPVGASGGIR